MYNFNMSNIFDKFCLEINYKKAPTFAKVDVISAKLQDNNIFKIAFKNMEIIPFNDMIDFIITVNNNFKYKTDLSFEINSITYEQNIVEDYVSWIIKNYLRKPYLSNAFLHADKSISNEGEMVIKLSNGDLSSKFNGIKKDLKRIMTKFGFKDFDIKIMMVQSEDHLKDEYLKIKKEAQNSFNDKKELSTKGQPDIKVKQGYNFVEIHEIKDSGLSRIETEGIIFKKDSFKTRTGLFIITIGITNNIDAIDVKFFAKTDKQIINFKKYEVGDIIDVRGNYQIDAYSKQPTIIGSTIKEANSKISTRKDNIKTSKRVELGVRTRMSTMDGVVSPKEVVKRAIEWGHEAIGIVDAGSVQSFPEFYNETKGKDIKPIYGVTLSILDRNNKSVFNLKNVNLEKDSYIVFDLETTGLSARYDDIIEFGAVKVENGTIIDKEQFFIKPSKDIPEKIIEITNITNEMVKDAISEKEAISKIIDYFGNHTLVAHNASFDYGFIQEKLFKYNLPPINNPCIDTLIVARIIHKDSKKFRLETVAKRNGLHYDSTVAHRADYDADILARIWIKMIYDLKLLDIKTQKSLSDYTSDSLYTKSFANEATLIAKNQKGLKKLFEWVSLASTNQLFKNPTIFYDQIVERKDLLFGTSSLRGRVTELMLNGSTAELENEIQKYDYIEVLPLDDFKHLFKDYSTKDIQDGIKLIISFAKKYNKLIVATGDVRYLDPDDKIYHEVYINAKGLGGSYHYLKRFRDSEPTYPDQHFRTTNEMKEQFSWLLDEKLINEIVIENTNKLNNLIDPKIEVIKNKLYTPKMGNSDSDLEEKVYENAYEMYGNPLPTIVKDRIARELNPIKKHGFGVIYWISHLLVSKSLNDGYLVGSRGSVGSSIVATLSNITEVNPLPPHYLCSKCKHSEFFPDSDLNSGYDLENKLCPKCDILLMKEGQKIPFETFLGFDADKVPDIDLNFSGEYQPIIHNEVKKIFGENHVFRAGTISTVAEKTAFGYVKGWADDTNKNISRSFIEYLAKKVWGTKRTTGQHPGGIIVIPKEMSVDDFTPINYPANDKNSEWKTTHFDFHAIHDNVLKLDLLGHDDPTAIKYLEKLTGVNVKKDIPFSDPRIISLFSSTKELGISPEDIDGEKTGAMGIPEFGTNFVRRMLTSAKVTSFGDLIALSGLSHGTDVWSGNAENVIKEKGKTLSEVISCRDNIMTDLIAKGIEPLTSFKIMEKVRKGKGITTEEEKLLQTNNVEDWYIESLQKIKYMFPKAHATAYVMMAWRIAWFKIYHPIAYYAAYFTTRSDVFDIETIVRGKDYILEKLRDFKDRKGKRGEDALSNKEVSLIPIYELALEAIARDVKINNINMHKSQASNWIIADDGSLIPPFEALDGLGHSAAKSIVDARNESEFTSIEDIKSRTSLNKTNLGKLDDLGALKEFSVSNQLEFDLFSL